MHPEEIDSEVQSGQSRVAAGHPPVVPPLTAALRRTAADGRSVWPSMRLRDIVDELAAANQAVLDFQLWQVQADGELCSAPMRCGIIELDLGQPWPALVAQAHLRASLLVHFANIDERVVATIEWVDVADFVPHLL